jgi:mono/diheme cytochrome c family protein
LKAWLKPLIVALAACAAVVAAALAYVRVTGLSARAQPGPVETAFARRIRAFAIPAEARQRQNPEPASPAAVADGMAHFADHCAFCHANDGSGQTSIGQGLFPKPPDMRGPATQDMTDGELFYIIENGIRFTGMPGFATGDPEGETSSWHLVHFIRRLPDLTTEQIDRMEEMNPRPPAEIRREIAEEEFLKGNEE